MRNKLLSYILIPLFILLLILLAVNRLGSNTPINTISPISYTNINNELYGFGSNFGGQLGVFNTLKSPVEIQSLGAKNIIKYDAGNKHSIVLTIDGEVIQYGINGISGEVPQRFIEFEENNQLNKLANIVDISAGADFSLALAKDGSVWSWGNNLAGQLGQGNNTSSINAKKIDGLANITQISAGYKFGLALNKYGEVYAWGGSCSNERKEQARQWLSTPITIVGIGGYYDPTSLGGSDNINNQSEDFNSYCANEEVIGFSSKTPIRIEGLNSIVKVSAGWGHTLAIDSNGDVWGVGCNLYKQISNSPNHLKPYKIPGLKNITEISAGFRHSLALDKDNKVHAWGYNLRGGLGLKNNSEIEPLPKIVNVSDVRTISAGHDFSVLTTYEDKLIIFGENNSGVITKDLNTIYTPNPTEIYNEYSFLSAIAGKSFVLGLISK